MTEISISELHDHPLNDFFFDQIEGQKRDEFVESVRTSGIIEPIVITDDNVIVAGHQRKAAGLEVGLEVAPCVVRTYTDHDGRARADWIIKDLIESNVRQRGDVGGSELKAVRRVDELRRIYNITHGGARRGDNFKSADCALENQPRKLEDVCCCAGTDITTYRRYKHLTDLSPEIQQLLEDGEINVTLANEIVSRLSFEEQAQLVAKLPCSGDITSRTAEGFIEEIEKLRKDNVWFQQGEDETSKKLDQMDLQLNEMRDENARIKAGRGTDAERKLAEKLDEARIAANKSAEAKRIAELSLSRQKELREADQTSGRVIEQQIGNLCGVVLNTSTTLADLPSSIFLKLETESRRAILDMVARSIDNLMEVQTLLSDEVEVAS